MFFGELKQVINYFSSCAIKKYCYCLPSLLMFLEKITMFYFSGILSLIFKFILYLRTLYFVDHITIYFLSELLLRLQDILINFHFILLNTSQNPILSGYNLLCHEIFKMVSLSVLYFCLSLFLYFGLFLLNNIMLMHA